MDLNSLYALLAIDAVFLGFVALAGFLAWGTRCDLKTERARSIAEADEICSAILALRTELAEVKAGAPGTDPVLRAFVSAPVLTADRRAEALGMLRNGADSQMVSVTLGLSTAETVLLRKVQDLRSSGSSRE
jgi:hypothetical protein